MASSIKSQASLNFQMIMIGDDLLGKGSKKRRTSTKDQIMSSASSIRLPVGLGG